MSRPADQRLSRSRSRDNATAPITLQEMVTALDSAVVQLVEAPNGADVALASAALVDAADLDAVAGPPNPLPDVYLLVGVPEADAVAWLGRVAKRRPDQRPAAVMAKIADTPALRAAARGAGVALAAIHPKARWDHVLALVQQMLGRARRTTATALESADLLDADTDLFDLAQVVAANAGGMVSIEDAQSKVLAYSASDESADELRTLSILGREGPREYLRALEQWGVFERLRRTDEVIDIPAHDELGTRRRLVVGIRRTAGDRSAPQMLGSIWVQEGATAFAPDAADVLRGASAVAARLISRSLNAPTTEGLLIQRLFGEHGGGVDIPTVTAALNLVPGGPAAVLGFASSSGDAGKGAEFASIGSLLRLHASSFRRDAVATIIGSRAYVLLPQYKSAGSVSAWARQLVDQLEAKRALLLRAAIALPLAGLSQVASARAEVDRVLDATATTYPDGRVTTLAESLTPVLLGEILDLIAAHPELADPRLGTLDDYDRDHDGSLRASAHAYLTAYGDVRSAAAALNIHPNTLRYRLRRVEEILGINIAEHADRMLLELQLAVGQRGPATGSPS